jgi:hypothetical protein
LLKNIKLYRTIVFNCFKIKKEVRMRRVSTRGDSNMEQTQDVALTVRNSPPRSQIGSQDIRSYSSTNTQLEVSVEERTYQLMTELTGGLNTAIDQHLRQHQQLEDFLGQRDVDVKVRAQQQIAQSGGPKVRPCVKVICIAAIASAAIMALTSVGAKYFL